MSDTLAHKSEDKLCLVCGRGSEATPLIGLAYRERGFWICPQHLPVLIHDPGQLAGKLPGAEHLKPADPEAEC